MPACERDLNTVGISTAEQLKQVGIEGALLYMLTARKREGGSAAGCNAGELCALHGVLHDVDFRDVPVEQRDVFKQFTADLRESVAYA